MKKLSACFSLMLGLISSSPLLAVHYDGSRAPQLLPLPQKGVLFTTSEIEEFKIHNILKMAETFIVQKKDGSCQIVSKKNLHLIETSVKFASIALADVNSLTHPILYTTKSEDNKILGIYARMDAPAIYTETNESERAAIKACLRK